MTLTQHAQATEAFEEALKRFEIALEAPIVPGEIEQWVHGVRETAQACSELLRPHIDTVHEQECQEIVKEDSEMFRHVKQLKQAGQESLQRMEAFLAKVNKLARRAPQQEPAEIPAHKDLGHLSDEGLALVIHIRKHEVGRRTWLQEAFNRLRGDVD